MESATVIVFDKLIGLVALALLVAVTLPLGRELLAQRQQVPPELLPLLIVFLLLTAGGTLTLVRFPHVLGPLLDRVAGSVPARLSGVVREVARGQRLHIGTVDPWCWGRWGWGW